MKKQKEPVHISVIINQWLQQLNESKQQQKS